MFLTTNASFRSREELLEKKLKQVHGYDKIPFNRIYTASYVTAENLKKVVAEANVENPAIYVVGMAGMRKELTDAGLRIINHDDADDTDTMTESELATYQCDPSVVAVAAGVDFKLTYRKICIASLYLQVNDAKFVCTNPDRYSGKNNRFPAGAGTVIRAIETASGRKAEVMGKPSQSMFNMIRE